MTRIGRLSPPKIGWRGRRRVLLLLACVISLVVVAIAEAPAQENQATEAASRDAEPPNLILNSNDVRLFAAPARAVSADTAEPVQVDFRITGMPAPEAPEGDETSGVPEPAPVELTSLSGVTFRGYTRFVAAGDEEGTPTYGQVIITGIERGPRRARLDGFGATWALPEDAEGLEAGEQLLIEGNADALTAALDALDAPAEEEAGDEPELRVASDSGPATETVGQPGGGGEKSDYKTPEPLTTAKKADAKTPERKTVETAAGCNVRVDTDLEVVFQQIRDQVVADGKIVSQTDCYDSYKPEGRFALKKSYAGCPVAVDEAGGRATSRYQFYYTDAANGDSGGAMRIVGNCTEDPDLAFDIVEDHGSCPVAITGGQAVPQAAKTYRNRAGRKVVVRGCGPSESKQPVQLVKATGECNIRHDMQAGRSVVRGVDTYTIDQVTHQVGVCADTETAFAHETDFEGCSVSVDLPGRLATASSRIIYRDGNQDVIEVRGCRPDKSRTFAITEELAGCEVAIDYESARATPQAKLIYLDADRRRVEARGCAPATTVRPSPLVADSADCAMRHDFAGLRTHERATYSYVLDGGSFTAARCRETGRSYALRKDYAACEAEIEARVGGRVVTKFRWSYSDDGSRKQYAGDCVVDVDIRAGIVEDFSSCTTAVDFETGMATPQARLVYNDRTGQVVEIEPCRPSVGKPAVRLVADTGDCEATVDLRGGSVAEMASYRYELDSELRQASGCRATGRTFDLSRDYAGCKTAIDLEGRQAIDHFRMIYSDGGGEQQVAADCTADPARRFAIAEEFNACDVAVDYTGLTATPHAKLVYQDATRRRVEVRDCAPATTKRAATLVADKQGCEMRLDVPGLKIFEQAAYSYSLDGGRHEASPCRDTGTSFALVKDFAGCPDDVDLRGGRVTTKSRWAYVDAQQRRQTASDCAAEPGMELALSEDFAGCRTALDYQGLRATPQSRLVYTDRNGQQVEARGCEASASKQAVLLVADTGDCEAAVNLRGGSVAEMASYSYELDNAVITASACRVTGRTFDLSRDYAGCETAIDLDGRQAIDHFRMVYRDGDSKDQVAADCAPDPARRFAITEEFTGCDVAVDYTGLTATPHAKLVYQDATRRRVEVRDCAPATTKRAVTLVADNSGCEMRQDLTERRIYQTATYSYVLDGGTVTTARCRETGVSFPLKKDFAACAIDVDLRAKRATQHFRWAWQDGNDRRQFASDCAADPELVFAITETAEGCETVIDYANGRATPQGRLVYHNRLGQPVEARGCAPSETRAAAVLAADTSACPARADIRGGIVHERAGYSYEMDSAIRQASGCRDTGRTFELTRDEAGCETAVDLQAMRATAQYRMVWRDGAGTSRVAQDCRADRSRQVAVREDFAACQVAIDYDAGTATPHSALVYSGFNGREVTARPCAPSPSKQAVSLTVDPAGCAIRHDIPARKSYPRADYSYSLDGATVEVAGCRETGVIFTLEKGFAGCETAVNLGRREAQGHYRWVYVDEEGRNQPAGECIADEELVFAIHEDFEACPVFIDYRALRAVPRSVLWYSDRNGQRTEARGCETSDTKPAVRLVSRTDTCPLEHDLTAGISYEMGIHAYTMDEVTYQVGGCTKTGRSFRQDKVYVNSQDQYICEPLIDRDAGEVTRRHRLRISVGGALRFVSECAPDEDGELAIVATTQGCDDPASWEHDIARGVTHGMERFYYVRENRQREYVSGCLASSATYRHSHSITGYQYNDADLSAWAVTEVSITVGQRKHIINTGMVLPGARKQPYVKIGTINEASGEIAYEGCDAFQPTNRYERWRRPDRSVYQKPIGAGSRLGPRHACRSDPDRAWRVANARPGDAARCFVGRRTNFCGEHNGSYCNGRRDGEQYDYYRYGQRAAIVTYRGQRRMVREDSHIVATHTATRERVFSGSCTGQRWNRIYPGSVDGRGWNRELDWQ